MGIPRESPHTLHKTQHKNQPTVQPVANPPMKMWIGSKNIRKFPGSSLEKLGVNVVGTWEGPAVGLTIPALSRKIKLHFLCKLFLNISRLATVSYQELHAFLKSFIKYPLYSETDLYVDWIHQMILNNRSDKNFK